MEGAEEAWSGWMMRNVTGAGIPRICEVARAADFIYRHNGTRLQLNCTPFTAYVQGYIAMGSLSSSALRQFSS